MVSGEGSILSADENIENGQQFDDLVGGGVAGHALSLGGAQAEGLPWHRNLETVSRFRRKL